MKLSDLGEGGLLDLLREWTAAPSPGIAVGPGDDAAVLDVPGATHQIVITTDAWVEGVHFSRALLAPDEIGHRAMAGSLSDLAAMGATGLAAFVNLHAPPDLPVDFVRGVYQGMERIAGACGVGIAGGDTVKGELALGITAVGTVPRGRAVLRSGAKAGDAILVSGELGRSEAGRLLLAGEVHETLPERLRVVAEAAHRSPRPRFDVAKVLTTLERRTVDAQLSHETIESVRPTAMIDVSDGLALDLRRLCAESGVGCRIEEARIPVDGAARRIARNSGLPDTSLALGGGEDFELLFTIAAKDVELLLDAVAKVRLDVTAIGQITRGAESLRLVGEDGTERPLPDLGWDHFRAKPDSAKRE
ncbi:MAG: thiamine-phosphate kinase [Candidatus Eiseniibacteriota bacterium]